ncbi:DUF1579 domain-containing protein [Mesorhizobium sp. NBSH29]|uniref:DUF1579 domain-containing protein n=1 Tax=Mesorhizobium sp. NBSH29 TaxID=2654249 RepID=UPI0021563331|nr:DUF1579 domain-containing protein [Mesorhizobium sp. NBSH29]
MATEPSDGRYDFDPLFGRWTVRHRRLRTRLTGARDWQDFDGSSHMQPLLGGLGNVEDSTIDMPGDPYCAVALRSFDPVTKLWAIWWLDGRHPHSVNVPVRGRFENGTGTFLCDDTFEGKPITVRFTWTNVGTDAPSWRQAFSADGGVNWELNWEMQFSRLA